MNSCRAHVCLIIVMINGLTMRQVIPFGTLIGTYLAAFLQTTFSQMKCAQLPTLMQHLTTTKKVRELKKCRSSSMACAYMCLPL